MNAPRTDVAVLSVNIPSLHMDEAELIKVLQSSMYPGAAVESIKLVIGYCRGNLLDPMLKPVHIVPMDVKVKGEGGKETYVKRDVIMPGIGLYRTQAARTGLYAGMSEPEFGPTKKIPTKIRRYNNAHDNDKSFTMVDGPDIEFPEWCRVTVRRLLGGQAMEFTAVEYWQENYAVAGKDTTAPNAMWKRRPFGQLAKCAEAQALRKAFPEVGSQPTAEELEGKPIDETGAPIEGQVLIDKPAVEMPKAKTTNEQKTSAQSQPASAADAGPSGAPSDRKEPAAGGSGGGAEPDATALSQGESNWITKKMTDGALTEIDLHAKFGKKLADLTKADFPAVKTWCLNPSA